MKDVLLIDDDSIAIFIGKKILDHTGIVRHVYTSQSGIEALDLLRSLQQNDARLPDVILLDLDMPVMDGFRFLIEFKKLLFPVAFIKICIVSSSKNAGDIARATELGADLFLFKPLEENHLLEYLKAC